MFAPKFSRCGKTDQVSQTGQTCLVKVPKMQIGFHHWMLSSRRSKCICRTSDLNFGWERWLHERYDWEIWLKPNILSYVLILRAHLKYQLYNLSSIRLAENSVFHARTKHIEVHYHYIRKKVLEGKIEMVPTKIDEQLADIFTKGLNKAKFEKFRETLAMVCKKSG